MSDWPKNTEQNQVSLNSINGKYHVLWRGQLVNNRDGRMREFATDREAWDFLARCDTAGRIIVE
jgi:hypothetical protein